VGVFKITNELTGEFEVGL